MEKNSLCVIHRVNHKKGGLTCLDFNISYGRSDDKFFADFTAGGIEPIAL